MQSQYPIRDFLLKKQRIDETSFPAIPLASPAVTCPGIVTLCM